MALQIIVLLLFYYLFIIMFYFIIATFSNALVLLKFQVIDILFNDFYTRSLEGVFVFINSLYHRWQ